MSGFQRKADAKTWHDDTLRRLKDDGTIAQRTLTFEDLLAEYERKHLSKKRPGTRTRFEREIRLRIQPFFESTRLDRLTPGLVEDFQVKVLSDLKDPKSASMPLDLLRNMLNKAVKWKMLRHSPYELEPIEIPEKPYEWWDERRFPRLLVETAYERTRYFLFYWIKAELGPRYGEPLAVTPNGISFEDGTIHIWRQWLDHEKTFGPCKHNLQRFLPFDPKSDFGLELRAHCRRIPRDQPLFLNREGRIPRYKFLAQKMWYSLLERAGLPVIPEHGQRHTFASWYMRDYDDLWALKYLLGHASIESTQKYAHHSKKRRHQPLSLTAAASLTNRSHLHVVSGSSIGNQEGKPWWRIGDSNSLAPVSDVSRKRAINL